MIKQSGWGLTDALISVFLTSLITMLLMQFYVSNKQQYLQAQQKLETNFDIQWVSDVLSDSVRRAGFTPCLGINQLEVVDRRHFKATVSAITIDSPSFSSLGINRMSEHFDKIILIRSPTQLLVTKGTIFRENHHVLIADCEHAEIHQILRVDREGRYFLITLTRPLLFSYSVSTYLGEWLEERWFIRENDKKIKSLFYKSVQVEELSSLIHSLQINLHKVNGKILLEIILGLDKNKTQKLLVAVRGS